MDAKPSITGYRVLSDAEVSHINRLKALAEDVGSALQEVSSLPDSDQRWLSIGRTDLQKGFMAVIRAIAKPTTF